MSYTYEYPRPALTVDCVIFGKEESQELKVLLIQRGGEPFKGKWAFPGGFVNENEAVEQAAQRELIEETHLENNDLIQFGVFSEPGRDPRGWVVSIAFCTLVNIKDTVIQADDDADDARWVPLTQITEMAFDHKKILEQALETLKKS